MAKEKFEPPEFLREKERFFADHQDMLIGRAWYYRSREGVFGPFDSLEAAEGDLADLIFTNPDKREKYVK